MIKHKKDVWHKVSSCPGLPSVLSPVHILLLSDPGGRQ